MVSQETILLREEGVNIVLSPFNSERQQRCDTRVLVGEKGRADALKDFGNDRGQRLLGRRFFR